MLTLLAPSALFAFALGDNFIPNGYLILSLCCSCFSVVDDLESLGLRRWLDELKQAPVTMFSSSHLFA
jgi:hypothetical protein